MNASGNGEEVASGLKTLDPIARFDGGEGIGVKLRSKQKKTVFARMRNTVVVDIRYPFSAIH